jgi:hypothetical protein
MSKAWPDVFKTLPEKDLAITFKGIGLGPTVRDCPHSPAQRPHPDDSAGTPERDPDQIRSYDDPMKSKGLGRWLQGDLHPPK